jgi:hypothetical protein
MYRRATSKSSATSPHTLLNDSPRPIFPSIATGPHIVCGQKRYSARCRLNAVPSRGNQVTRLQNLELSSINEGASDKFTVCIALTSTSGYPRSKPTIICPCTSVRLYPPPLLGLVLHALRRLIHQPQLGRADFATFHFH